MQLKKIITHNPYYFFGKRETKEINKKIDGVKRSFTAIKNIREEENVLAYTKLKPYKSKDKSDKKQKTNIVFSVKNNNDIRGYTELKAYPKKKFWHKVKGFLPVDSNNNDFIAVIRLRILPFILIILLLFGMLFGLACCDAKSNPDSPWIPIIEDFTNQSDDKTPMDKADTIDVQGFTSMVVDKDTGEAKVLLRNPEGNPCYFEFCIYTDSGIPLYQSKLVPPDKELKKITLNTTLEEGKHKGYVLIKTYELETGAEMNSAKFAIDIISR